MNDVLSKSESAYALAADAVSDGKFVTEIDALDEMLGGDRAEKRAYRLENCGRFLGRYFKPESGAYSARPFYCNMWRDNECPICFQRRVEELRDRVLLTAARGEVRVVRLANHTLSKALADSLPRVNYLRLPQRDGSEVFFVQDDGLDGNVISAEWVKKSDWPQLADTPLPRRVSGQLGNEKGNVVEIIVPSVVLGSVTVEQEKKAIETAMEETESLRPTTIEELEAALQVRMKSFVNALEAAGGKILHSTNGKYTFDLKTVINWSYNTLDSAREVVGSGYEKKVGYSLGR